MIIVYTLFNIILEVGYKNSEMMYDPNPAHLQGNSF